MPDAAFSKNGFQRAPEIKKTEYKTPIKADICIVGAGASGLFAAWLLAGRGLKIHALEAGGRPGRKLAVSGGGHANFTNLDMSREKFLAPPSDKFCIPALHAWTPLQMIEFMEKAGFSIEEKKKGKLFLVEPAIKLVKFLLQECQKQTVQFHFNERLLKLEAGEGGFLAESDNLVVQAPMAVLALGSPARPKLASCLYCWKILSDMGHKVFPAKPALTPLNYTKKSQDYLRSLSGVSASVRLTLENGLVPDKVFEDDLLFTFTGLSGPAILRASLYFTAQSSLVIDFLPNLDFEEALARGGKTTPRSFLRPFLPPRLTDALIPPEMARRNAAELSKKDRALLGGRINAWRAPDLKAAGLESAEVCSGGADLGEINPRTMESKLFKGLYICGETQNVTGELGGYNLHWAFASARLACLDILEKGSG